MDNYGTFLKVFARLMSLYLHYRLLSSKLCKLLSDRFKVESRVSINIYFSIGETCLLYKIEIYTVCLRYYRLHDYFLGYHESSTSELYSRKSTEFDNSRCQNTAAKCINIIDS